MKENIPGLLAFLPLWLAMSIFMAHLSPETELLSAVFAAFLPAALLSLPAAFVAGLLARVFLR